MVIFYTLEATKNVVIVFLPSYETQGCQTGLIAQPKRYPKLNPNFGSSLPQKLIKFSYIFKWKPVITRIFV